MEHRSEGDFVCTQCGLVLGHVFDDMEWTNHTDDTEDHSRVGYEREGGRLSTVIADTGPVATSLIRTQMWMADDKQQVNDSILIGEMTAKFNLPSECAAMATELWAQVRDQATRGMMRSALIGVCIYMGSNVPGYEGVGRSVTEMAAMCGCSIKHFHEAKERLMQRMKAAPKTVLFQGATAVMSRRKNMLVRKVNMLGLDKSETWAVVKTARKVDALLEEYAVGQSHNVEMFSSAIVWVACNIQGIRPHNKKAFCALLTLSTNTLNKHTALIEDALREFQQRQADTKT